MILEISDERLNTLSFDELVVLFRVTAFSGCVMVVTTNTLAIQQGTRQVVVDPEGRMFDMLRPYLSRPGVRDFLLRRLPLARQTSRWEEGPLWFDIDVPATPTEPYVWLRILAPMAVFAQGVRECAAKLGAPCLMPKEDKTGGERCFE